MGYYDIYIKRINRFGNTLQERIQNKREHDFLTFMSKSPNRVSAWNGDSTTSYDAILQTKEYDEDEVIDYLLVPYGQEIPMGTIIYTQDTRFPNKRRWINYALDPYTTSGYDRFTIVELETDIVWVDQGVKYTSPAHAVGGGSGARDKNINLKFKTQFSESGVYLPNKRYSLVMPTRDNLKKGTRITLGGETWRVTGVDKISIKGVSFVTLQEYLTDEVDDKPFVSHGRLEALQVSCNLGENFSVKVGKKVPIQFTFYYNDEKIDIPYEVQPSDKYTFENQDDGILLLPSIEGDTQFSITVGDEDETERVFKIPFSIAQQEDLSLNILGPDTLFMGSQNEYIVVGVDSLLPEMVEISNDCASVNKILSEDKKVLIYAEKIGNFSIKITTSQKTVEKNISVKSIWLGGD